MWANSIMVSTTMATPRSLTAIYRNDKVYLLMAAANEATDVGPALEHIRQTWQWND